MSIIETPVEVTFCSLNEPSHILESLPLEVQSSEECGDLTGRRENTSCSNSLKTEKIGLQSTTRSINRLPHEQVLYLTQLFVISVLDICCLLKLTLIYYRASLSCDETALYLSILSSTLGYLIPPPSYTKDPPPKDEAGGDPGKSIACDQVDSVFPGTQSRYHFQIELKRDSEDNDWHCCGFFYQRKDLYSFVKYFLSLFWFCLQR